MDTRIENKDIVLKPDGNSDYVTDIEQAVQQVNLALKIPKASFIYDRKIGAFEEDYNIYKDEIEGDIEAMVNECLLNTNVYATVEYVNRNVNVITVGLLINDGINTEHTEVVFYG